jgi:hydroxymethylglutaryl-CoA lyase
VRALTLNSQLLTLDLVKFMAESSSVTIIECPRDAWQGLAEIIPTGEKIRYLTTLVSLGFQHIDAVSFVSPKHVPQMADSEAVMKELSGAKAASGEAAEIIGIVVNGQGLERALATPGVTTVGYPYSISAYFRRANANMSRAESRELVEKLRRETKAAGRKLVVYISMAFGNPYEEPWGPEIVEDTLVWLKDIGVRTVSLADTVGTASPETVAGLYRAVKDCVAGVEIGVHLHSRPEGAAEKVLGAYEAGCRRFDGALTGLGGCPFAGDALVGNIPTETVLTTLAARGVATGIDTKSLAIACAMTHELRERYAHGATKQAEASKPN